MVQKVKKILVPKTVSSTVRGKLNGKITRVALRPDKTKAFVERGTKMPRGLSPKEQFIWLKKIAHASNYFIKPLSPKTKKIRNILEKNGIKVEKAIQDLKNGKFLFEKTGNSLDSVKGIKLYMKNREKNVEKIGKIMKKMHSLGITHNHLHIGNIALTDKGNVILLDFGRASLSEKNITKGTNILMDIYQAAQSLAKLEAHALKLNQRQQQKREKEIYWSFLDNYPKETILMLEKNVLRKVNKKK